MTRKRSSWGSNQSMGQGKRRIRYMADTGDGRGYTRRSETVYGTRKQADEVLAQRRIEHSQDKPVPTLRQAYEAWWLPEITERLNSKDLSQNTYQGYVSRWKVHIEPTFGDMSITAIRPLSIQEWLSTMTYDIASSSLRVLKQILDKCVLFEIISANPASASYRLPRQRVARDKTVYSLSELEGVLAALKGSVAYPAAVLCGIGSCRVGEALGVRSDDVSAYRYEDMTLAIVNIERQVDNSGNVLSTLKNPQSRRPVIIPEPWSLDILDIENQWLSDKGYGQPIGQPVFRTSWKKDLQKCGLKYIPTGNLRNSWRTIYRWELGIDEDMVEKMMGHAGKNVGEIHYDRPQWQQFADIVATAWMKYRAKKIISN